MESLHAHFTENNLFAWICDILIKAMDISNNDMFAN